MGYAGNTLGMRIRRPGPGDDEAMQNSANYRGRWAFGSEAMQPVKTMSRDGPTLCSMYRRPVARGHSKIQKAPRSRNLESAPHGKRHAHTCMQRIVVTKSNTGSASTALLFSVG